MRFRYARHTVRMSELITFYTQILNCKILGNFKDHAGYDGTFLGYENENWHMEFTQNGDIPESHFDEDDLLVFYPQSREQHQIILDNIKKYNIPTYPAKNPYWNDHSILIKDPDGYGIIISPQSLP